MPTIHLTDRMIVEVTGPDAEQVLQNVITTDLDVLGDGEAKPGALLTPQGKILFDFLISRHGEDGFRLDCRADIADDLARRLTLYRMRAKMEISKPEQAVVLARWQVDSGASQNESGWLADKRFPDEHVLRGYDIDAEADASVEDWRRLRIINGIAESGSDYELGDAFPHDVLLDETGGIGFKKGCYVGQEVVSRMQHRGTARRRVMIVESTGDLPASGTEIKANDRSIGTLGSVSAGDGLAIVRTDRVKDALDAGHDINADGVPLTLSIPSWAKYTLPQEANAAEGA